MKAKLLFATLAALTFAGCASTTTTPAEPAAKPVTAASAETATQPAAESESDVLARTETTADDEDRVICRTITPTGSHRKKTICRTVRDIKRDRESAQDALRTKQGAAVEGSGL